MHCVHIIQYQFSGDTVSRIDYPSFQLILSGKIPFLDRQFWLKMPLLIYGVDLHAAQPYFDDILWQKTRHDQQIFHRAKNHTRQQAWESQRRMNREKPSISLSIWTIKCTLSHIYVTYVWYSKIGQLKRNMMYIPSHRGHTHVGLARKVAQVCMMDYYVSIKLSGQPARIY